MSTWILDGLSDAAEAPHQPTLYQHILQLAIVVKDAYGRYLVLRMLPYGADEHTNGGGTAHGAADAQWILPAEAPYKVQWEPATTVRKVQSILNGLRKSPKAMQAAAENLAWQLGMNDAGTRYLGAVTLLKPSVRNPEHWLAIRFHTFLAWTSVSAGLRNLADPEGLLGLVHLPLDDLDSTVVRRRRDGGQEWWYRGKPIAPEVEFLLAPERRARLLERPVRLDPEHFYRQEQGLILDADLAGWGRALQEAKQMRTFGVDGYGSVDRLLESTAAAFYGLIDRVGPAYVQDTGDGLKAVFFERVFDRDEVLGRLLPGWLELLGRVEELNACLRHRDIAIGSRLVLHYGSYLHGRIGQARSQAPALQGMSIVEAARLEQGLANLVVERSGGAARLESGWRHTLAVSDAALERCGAALEQFADLLKPEGRHLLRAKESGLHAHIWHIDV